MFCRERLTDTTAAHWCYQVNVCRLIVWLG